MNIYIYIHIYLLERRDVSVSRREEEPGRYLRLTETWEQPAAVLDRKEGEESQAAHVRGSGGRGSS